MQVFLWPWLLVALVLVPVLIWLYRRGRRPAARSVVLHSDVALLTQAAGAGRRWARWLPAAAYLLAIGIALFALARPTLAVLVANPKAGIVLALDVSRSMQSSDVLPSRFAAARQALTDFVASLPEGARVGLVTFAGRASIVVPLTTEHERIVQAIDVVYLGRGTALGDALLESVKALPSLEEREELEGDPEDYASVILLSDGANRGGVSPIVALQEVKANRVRVYTVGVGRDDGGGSNGFGGFPGYGFRGAMRFDEATMRRVADETGGRFVMVDSAKDLSDVYRQLSKALAWRVSREEATGFVSLAAGLVLIGSLLLGRWRRFL